MTSGADKSELRSLLSATPQFSVVHSDEEVFHQRDLIELFPFGLSIQNESQRPFLLLKNSEQNLTLPVALNPLEAGLTVSGDQGGGGSPHQFARELLVSLDIQARQCVFVQIKGAHQYVRIYLQGHPKTNSLKLRADEAMSLCLHHQIPIFATKKFIQQSRLMTTGLERKTVKRPLPQSWLN